MTLKQQIHEHYRQNILHKITRLNTTLADLKESGANETKSTAGDKHETALAMLQLEQEKIRRQLAEVLQQLAALDKLHPDSPSNTINPGSLVRTNHDYLYLSVAGGRSVISNHSVIALSPQSPLGQRLKGLRTGDTITFNQIVYCIVSID